MNVQRPGGPLVVTITDNGVGFDPKLVRQSRTGSSGLVSMRERAATVGGTLKADNRGGHRNHHHTRTADAQDSVVEKVFRWRKSESPHVDDHPLFRQGRAAYA